MLLSRNASVRDLVDLQNGVSSYARCRVSNITDPHGKLDVSIVTEDISTPA